MVLALILLLSTISPLSRPVHQPVSAMVPAAVPSFLCSHAGHTWFFVGPDRATGVGDSCTKAFSDWKKTPSPDLIYYTI
jgi:hypothetical protein